MDQEVVIEGLIETLDDLKAENGVSKGLLVKIDEMIDTLKDDVDVSLRVDRMRSILEEIEAANNIPSFVRPQLMNITATIEML